MQAICVLQLLEDACGTGKVMAIYPGPGSVSSVLHGDNTLLTIVLGLLRRHTGDSNKAVICAGHLYAFTVRSQVPHGEAL